MSLVLKRVHRLRIRSRIKNIAGLAKVDEYYRMATPTVYLISGANRGIGAFPPYHFILAAKRLTHTPKGLGIVTALAARPDTIVFAGARNPSGATALANLAQAHPENVYTVQLTSGSRADNETAVKEIQRVVGRLDVVIANAGTLLFSSGTNCLQA